MYLVHFEWTTKIVHSIFGGKYEWKLLILLLLLFSTYDVRTNSMKIEDPNNEMNAFNFDASVDIFGSSHAHCSSFISILERTSHKKKRKAKTNNWYCIKISGKKLLQWCTWCTGWYASCGWILHKCVMCIRISNSQYISPNKEEWIEERQWNAVKTR